MMWMVSLVLAFGTLLAEWYIAGREKTVHQALGERVSWEKVGVYRALFYVSIGSLLVAFLISFSHRGGVTPRQGVAIVIDTGSFENKPSLPMAKGAINELLGGLGGIPCSLYEVDNGVLRKVVPRTIDRLFYNLLLDGIDESYSSIKKLSLYELQEEMRKSSTIVVPWMVLVTAEELAIGGVLDGVSCMTVQGAKIVTRSWTNGVLERPVSIAALASIISEYLSRSETPSDADALDMLALLIVSGIAFFSYVFWRKYVVAIGTAVFLTGVLHAHSPEEANWAFRGAQSLAASGSLDASQGEIEALLNATTNKIARRRLFFDRALIAYVAKSDEEAYVWLSMESSTKVDAEFEKRSNVLKSYLFLRLIEQTNPSEKKMWKSRLQEWLDSHPVLPKQLYNVLELAISSPNLHPGMIDETAKTLLWLEQQSRCVTNVSWPCEVAVALGNKTRSLVSQKLFTLSPQFSEWFLQDLQTIQGEDTVIRLRLWYDLAQLSSPENAVSMLTEEAATISQDAVIFPSRAAICARMMACIERNLAQLSERLPLKTRPFFKKIFESRKADAAMWYSRFVLWDGLQDWDMKTVNPIAEMLCEQVDAPLSPECQKTLTALTISACQLSNKVSTTQLLSTLCDEMLAKWYAEDPSTALEEVLAQLARGSPDWNARFIRLMSGVIQSAKGSDNGIAAAIAQCVENTLEEYDLVLIGRLWQVAVTEMDTSIGVAHNLDHLIMCFQEMKDSLKNVDERAVRSLCLLIAVHPSIAEALAAVSVFQSDEKRLRYRELLSDWVQACRDIQVRIEMPSTFRIPRVELSIGQAISALKDMRALLEEGTTPLPISSNESIGVYPQQMRVMIRPEDAVRLFQEMDRSDRNLFEG